MNKRAIGSQNEELASRYLSHIGFEILERNWTCFGGELDIVAKDDGILVFVEVKSVGVRLFCKPYEMFTYTKKAHVLRTINWFLHQNNLDPNSWRLDLVCLSKIPGKYDIQHYRDVLNT